VGPQGRSARRFAFLKAAIGATVGALLFALGAVQFASDAMYAPSAAAHTFPRLVPERVGASVYRALDRIVPAPYVEATLSSYALRSGDADAAERYALQLPASPVRDELLGRIALARGRTQLALEYFLAAPDADAVESAAQELAVDSPAAGYALERLLQARLGLLTTHPDVVAQTRWQMGLLANRQAWREVSGSPAQNAWLRRAMGDFEAAVALAPLSERYAIAAANQADLLGERSRATSLFQHGVDVDPSSADAIAGLGVMALQGGDRASALAYLGRARTIDPDALMVRALERALR